MANYKIYVDSSTKPSENFGYGKSAAAWIVDINGYIIRSGLIFSDYNGPNKIVYEGILAALSSLEPTHFYEGGTDNVEIFIDTQIIVNQLNSHSAIKMAKHKKLVLDFYKKHPNVTFNCLYCNEKNAYFKIVDTLSKSGRNWMPKMIKFKK